jgi:hypothetical protein
MRWLAQDLHTRFLLAKILSIYCAMVVIANHVAAIMRPRQHPTIAALFAARFWAASLLTNTVISEVPLVFKFFEHALWWERFGIRVLIPLAFKCLALQMAQFSIRKKGHPSSINSMLSKFMFALPFSSSFFAFLDWSLTLLQFDIHGDGN